MLGYCVCACEGRKFLDHAHVLSVAVILNRAMGLRMVLELPELHARYATVLLTHKHAHAHIHMLTVIHKHTCAHTNTH